MRIGVDLLQNLWTEWIVEVGGEGEKALEPDTALVTNWSWATRNLSVPCRSSLQL